MKVILFGLGSIGRRHARLLLEAGHEVHAFRSGFGPSDNELGLPEIRRWESVDALQPDMAVIANPTHCHMETALACAERNIPMFIEKPVCNSIQNLESLLHLVKRKEIPTYVAYVLRFHPKVMELKQKLAGRSIRKARFVARSFFPDWRPGQNHLESYTARHDAGGGALLDVSHEFDLASYLMGAVRNISGKLERRGDVTVDAEDYVEAAVQTDSGEAKIIIDIASQELERSIRIETDGEIFEVNLMAGGDRDVPYRTQLRYFLSNCNNPKMMNNLEEAAPLFEKVIQFREASFPAQRLLHA